jgi:hypothetical protein
MTFKTAIGDKIERTKKIELAKTREEHQQDVPANEYPTTINSKHQAVRKTEQLLKKCVYNRKGIHPRKFCRRWFGMENLNKYGRAYYTEEQIVAIESEHGYREKCINLIARVLKIKPNTVQRWGKGVEFTKIPLCKQEEYEKYLAYVDTIRIMSLSIARFNEELLLKLLHDLDFH